MQTQSETSTTKPFSVEEVNLQAQRILQQVTFRNSPTLSSFLNFIISETVQGRQQQIKEYTIALNVLNRSRDFKPQEDAVVRIHAGRLRRALNDYYITQGINDPIIIQIPKGSYVPEFRAADKSEPIAPLIPLPDQERYSSNSSRTPFQIICLKRMTLTSFPRHLVSR